MSGPKLRIAALGIAAATLLATAACGSNSGGGQAGGGGGGKPSGSSGVDTSLAKLVPSNIKSAGQVTVATDPTYAPMESIASNGNTIIGVDPDLGQALGKLLGVKFVFQKATFDGIIPGLASGKYGLGMSSFTDTKAREKVVNFVTYFKAGTALMVPSGNPKHLSVTDMSLCGHAVGAEKGTIQADDIASRSKKCTAAGKPAISQKVFPDQNAVNLALATGRIDAALADSGVAGYMAQQSNGKLTIVGQPYSTAPYGIAVPKNSGTFDKAIQGAVNKLIQNGTYDKILKKWSATQGAITKSQINAAVS